jgi:hypothetical protein
MLHIELHVACIQTKILPKWPAQQKRLGIPVLCTIVGINEVDLGKFPLNPTEF